MPRLTAWQGPSIVRTASFSPAVLTSSMSLFHPITLGTSCSGTTTRTTSQHPISPRPRQVQPHPQLSSFAPAPSTHTLTLVVTLTRSAGCVWTTFPGHASTKYTATMQIRSSDKVFLRAIEMPSGGVAAPTTCPAMPSQGEDEEGGDGSGSGEVAARVVKAEKRHDARLVPFL